jgi:CheY-like chemotaxis protein
MNPNIKPRILCVDDEPNVLESFRRLLRRDYDLNTAASAADGLRLIEQNGPYAVIVSDFRMPGMNGVDFLSRACILAPDSVRVMLTGHAEENTAAKAINDGRIFRFLYKPIGSEEFVKCLDACIRQYNLIFAEKDVLERTLKGSIATMTEILSMTNPLAFSRATRVTEYARQIGANMGVPDLWQLEVAAMLAHLGYVTIPIQTLQKRMHGMPVEPHEHQMFESLPTITQSLIGHIPRLENTLRIIQLTHSQQGLGTVSMNDSVALCAAILRTVLHLDELLEQGYGKSEAIREMMLHPDRYNQSVLDQLPVLRHSESGKRIRKVSINQLRVGMVLNESIQTGTGLAVAPKGFRINDLIRQLLKNLHLQDSIPEFVEVVLPDDDEGTP